MANITLRGYLTLPISSPFVEGQRLTLGEAQALNVLRAENLADAAKRQLAKNFPPGLLPPADEARFREWFGLYEANYKLRPRRRRSDPSSGELAKFVREVAVEHAQQEARRQGRELDGADLGMMVEALLEIPELRAEAERRFYEAKAVVDQELERLFGEEPARRAADR